MQVLTGVAGHHRIATVKAPNRAGGRSLSLMHEGQDIVSWNMAARTAVGSSIKRLVIHEVPLMLIIYVNTTEPLYVTPETEFYLPDTNVWTPAAYLQPHTRLQVLTKEIAKPLGLAPGWRGVRKLRDAYVQGIGERWTRDRDSTKVRSNVRRKLQAYNIQTDPGMGFFLNAVLVRTP